MFPFPLGMSILPCYFKMSLEILGRIDTLFGYWNTMEKTKKSDAGIVFNYIGWWKGEGKCYCLEGRDSMSGFKGMGACGSKRGSGKEKETFIWEFKEGLKIVV